MKTCQAEYRVTTRRKTLKRKNPVQQHFYSAIFHHVAD